MIIKHWKHCSHFGEHAFIFSQFRRLRHDCHLVIPVYIVNIHTLCFIRLSTIQWSKMHEGLA